MNPLKYSVAFESIFTRSKMLSTDETDSKEHFHGSKEGQEEVIFWCLVYELYRHVVVFKTLSAENQLITPFTGYFLHITSCARISWYTYSKINTNTDICQLHILKTSNARADTHMIILKTKTIELWTTIWVREHIHSSYQYCLKKMVSVWGNNQTRKSETIFFIATTERQTSLIQTQAMQIT